MRLAHYLTIAAAILLIVILYKGINTIPPAPKASGTPAAPMAGGMPSTPMAEAASFDSILTAARKQLPEHARSELTTIEQKITGTKDSAAMAPDFTSLAKVWQQHKQLPVAAFYYATAAKLENSEKKLNFAGQLFLDILHEAGSTGVQVWEGQQAIDCFERSLRINPGNDTTKLAMAVGYIEGTGELMQGVQILRGIVADKPDNVPANLMLGRMSVQSGQFDKAIARFETVLKADPKNTEALYFMAEAYKGKGDKGKAIELFEQCKKLVNKPDFSKDVDQYINSFK
ncbi:tetratricopeptide repeat protein [Chitinophagaceae bacterium MMS25-I14]